MFNKIGCTDAVCTLTYLIYTKQQKKRITFSSYKYTETFYMRLLMDADCTAN